MTVAASEVGRQGLTLVVVELDDRRDFGMLAADGDRRSREDGRTLTGIEAEAEVVRGSVLARGRHRLGDPASPDPAHFDEDGVLDTFELRRRRRKVGRIGHVHEEHGGEPAPLPAPRH